MDTNTLASGGVGASIIIGLGILYKVYIAINHHRIKCLLCGHKFDASIDIDVTVPSPPAPSTTS